MKKAIISGAFALTVSLAGSPLVSAQNLDAAGLAALELTATPNSQTRSEITNSAQALGPQIALPPGVTVATATPQQIADAVTAAVAANPDQADVIVATVLAVEGIDEELIIAAVRSATAALPADASGMVLDVVKLATVIQPTFAPDIAVAAATSRPGLIVSIGAASALMAPSQGPAIAAALALLQPDQADLIAGAINAATTPGQSYLTLADILPASVSGAIGSNPSNLTRGNNPQRLISPEVFQP